MLGVVNHFRLAPFKARLWSSRFIGSTNPFKPVSFQPYRSRNKVHQLDLARNAPSPVHGTSQACSSLLNSRSGLFPEPFFPQSFKFTFSLQLRAVRVPLSPAACELPSPTVCPRCGNYNVGGHCFSHQRADLNHLGLACESIYFNAVNLVHSLDSM